MGYPPIGLVNFEKVLKLKTLKTFSHWHQRGIERWNALVYCESRRQCRQWWRSRGFDQIGTSRHRFGHAVLSAPETGAGSLKKQVTQTMTIPPKLTDVGTLHLERERQFVKETRNLKPPRLLGFERLVW